MVRIYYCCSSLNADNCVCSVTVTTKGTSVLNMSIELELIAVCSMQS